MEIVIGVILIVSAVFLIVAVLLQSGKEKGLSGTISGNTADTFYGKNKGNTMDKILSKATTVISIIFVVLVLVSFIIQDDTDLDDVKDRITATETEESEVTEDTAESGADTSEDSQADTSAEEDSKGTEEESKAESAADTEAAK